MWKEDIEDLVLEINGLLTDNRIGPINTRFVYVSMKNTSTNLPYVVQIVNEKMLVVRTVDSSHEAPVIITILRALLNGVMLAYNV